ncbi:MAG TPA: VCBS repeat-containing protein [Polyangiaceae bacterium]|nr:VCBS repeat-containing protein [Polyangiaceae bacterium]
MRSFPASACLVVLLSGCFGGRSVDERGEHPATLTPTTSQALIRDASHNGGDPSFSWLPPVVRQAGGAAAFDPDVDAVVKIDEVGLDGAIVRNVATFSRDVGCGAARVRIVGQAYELIWSTKGAELRANRRYRATVFAGAHELGFADLDVVSNAQDLPRVDRDNYIPLLKDGVLNLRFHMNKAETPRDLCWAGFGASASTVAMGLTPFAIASPDLDGNGGPDLVVANVEAGTVSVRLSSKSGGFRGVAAYPVGAGPWAIVTADFDGDGKSDVAVANESSHDASILLNDGSGALGNAVHYATGQNPTGATAGDLNADGKPDLVIANRNSGTVSVLVNQGAGAFAQAVNYETGPLGAAPRAVAIADLNADGSNDLAVANLLTLEVATLLNHGDGTFSEPISYFVRAEPIAIIAADINGDSRPDLAVVTLANDVRVLINQAEGGFEPAVEYPTGTRPGPAEAIDVNADGRIDLAVPNATTNDVSIFVGRGDGTFEPARSFPADLFPQSVASADFNGDGRPDLAVANNSGVVSFLINEGERECAGN